MSTDSFAASFMLVCAVVVVGLLTVSAGDDRMYFPDEFTKLSSTSRRGKPEERLQVNYYANVLVSAINEERINVNDVVISPRFMIKVPCRNGRADHSGNCRRIAYWGQ